MKNYPKSPEKTAECEMSPGFSPKDRDRHVKRYEFAELSRVSQEFVNPCHKKKGKKVQICSWLISAHHDIE
jgi:hypothetical protein